MPGGLAPPGFPRLPATSERALVYLAAMIADGFTGKVTLHCYQGGVRSVTIEQTFQVKDLPGCGETGG